MSRSCDETIERGIRAAWCPDRRSYGATCGACILAGSGARGTRDIATANSHLNHELQWNGFAELEMQLPTANSESGALFPTGCSVRLWGRANSLPQAGAFSIWISRDCILGSSDLGWEATRRPAASSTNRVGSAVLPIVV